MNTSLLCSIFKNEIWFQSVYRRKNCIAINSFHLHLRSKRGWFFLKCSKVICSKKVTESTTRVCCVAWFKETERVSSKLFLKIFVLCSHSELCYLRCFDWIKCCSSIAWRHVSIDLEPAKLLCLYFSVCLFVCLFVCLLFVSFLLH